VRTWTALSAVTLLVLVGCASEPVPVGPPTEVATLKLPFRESFSDTEGAKRVVLCALSDKRPQRAFVGEGSGGPDGTGLRKFVLREDPTLVLPRMLGGYLKRIGFNVTFAERLPEVRGGVVRECLETHGGDYLIAGVLEELYCRVRSDPGHPAFVVVSARIDIYNEKGQVRMYYPARRSLARFLGDQPEQPEQVAAVLNEAIQDMFTRAFENRFFVEKLDLEPATVAELLQAAPAAEEPMTVETAPREPTPPSPDVVPPVPPPLPEPPREMTEQEKLEQQRRDAARELEDAVEETTEP